ncbi:MAG TPA: T9SS type A sorting domain-containing protein [Candidatus Enterocola sp.]|jgi:hypothetical protein|nr:T9SS type A sorting domain-containing protein [Candidatus Enterocola sp.]
MKKTFTLLAFSLSVVSIVKFTNLTAEPAKTPNGGYSGAPATNRTCQTSGCHGGTSTTDASQFILQMDTLQSGLSSGEVTSSTTYIPGKTYFMSLQLTGTANRYGFELSSLNGSNAQAGSFTATSSTTTAIVTGASGTTCMSHKNANSTKSWIWQWTAPATAQDVSFYYVGMLANGNNNESGDIVYKNNVTITAAQLPNAIANVSSITNLGLYPTQTVAEFALNIELKEALKTTIQIVDMKGSVVKTLFEGNLNEGSNNVRYDIADLQKGNYIVNVNTEKGAVSKHLIKL